jgi:hypothetical protein
MRIAALLLSTLFPLWLFAQQSTSRFKQFQAYKYMEEGVTEYETGNYDGALAYFDRAAEQDPNQKEIYRYRADARFRLGQYERSVSDYNVAISLDPQDAKLYNARGMAYARQSLYYSAVQDYKKALAIDPGFAEASRNLAIAERSSGYSSASVNPAKPTSPSWSSGGTNPSSPWTSSTPSQPTTPIYDAPGGNQVQEYIKPIVGGQAQDYITIEKVRTTPSSTFVTFTVEAPRRNSVSIFIHRPGTQGAFYITDQTFTQEYKLKGMSGLNGWSTPTEVPARESKQFTLEFEKIPYSMQAFHLIEGKNPGDKAWNFYQIELK